MKYLHIVLALLFITGITKGQDTLQPKRNAWNKIDLSNRANDHFMLQFGIDKWGSVPDSINISGSSRHFNMYFMLDKPFKTSPHLSFAFGAGIGSSNIFFNSTYIDLKANSTRLPFKDVSAENHFKKYKLTTVFLEAPVEFRFVSNVLTPDKGFKASIGAKIGTLLNAHTKGKNLIDKAGQSVYGNRYIMKESEKRFINNTRLALTTRVGFGNLSLHGSYQITNFLKEGAGPEIRPYSIGLTLSGL
jgi:hypothetical protein